MNRKLSYVILALVAFLALAQPAAAFTTVSATASNKRLLILAASGYRNRTSGDLNNVGSNGNYWSAAQNSADNAYNLNFNSGNVNPLNNNNRANGFSVLPVRAFNRLGIFKANDMQLTRGQIYALVVAAYLDARQNERNKNSALAFELDLENNLKTLADRLYRREWKPGPVICFMITEPTLREVFAPLFEDRIVSHVLFNLIAPLFDRTLIYDSYSCRKGKAPPNECQAAGLRVKCVPLPLLPAGCTRRSAPRYLSECCRESRSCHSLQEMRRYGHILPDPQN